MGFKRLSLEDVGSAWVIADSEHFKGWAVEYVYRIEAAKIHASCQSGLQRLLQVVDQVADVLNRSEEHTSELQSH